MFVAGDAYLITVANPLGLVTLDHLPSYGQSDSKSTKIISKSLVGQLVQYKSEGFYVYSILTDNEPSIIALKPIINEMGAKLITTGVQSHAVAIVDRKIRFIKEKVRSILSGLLFPVPHDLLKWVVYFAASRINLIRHGESNSNLSPRELFTGQRTDFNKDLRIAFGDYVQALVPDPDNSIKERTNGCIALLPTGNKNGSVLFYSLVSGRVVTRDTWTEVPIPRSCYSTYDNSCFKGQEETDFKRPNLHV